MQDDRFAVLAEKFLEGMLTPEEQKELAEFLNKDPSLRQELAELKDIGEVMKVIKLKSPDEEAMERFWSVVYNRIERAVGMILLSLGAILLLAYGVYMLISDFLRDPSVPIVVRLGVVGVVLGLIVLLVSVVKERLAILKVDRYSKEVDK